MSSRLYRQCRRLCSLLVRQHFSSECEVALNKQINMELKACHDYLAMAYHFNRSDVAFPGVFKFFKEASLEERTHAEKLMEYMNKRGGQIILDAIPAPKCGYESLMEAMKEALNMEKAVNDSLLALQDVANKANDPCLVDFVITGFMNEQIDAQKQLADYIRQIERSEKELGSFIFDLNLLKSGAMH